ncbi:MAG: hypothetical protein MPW15_28205 [Candidatus Manganitrophus sp.]|nr:hypothetical protein [Candidatus Manganitrophus sp.]
MLKEIEKVIVENGPRWEIPFFPPRALYFTKTAGSKKNPTAQPVVFLLFDQNGAAPRWVVKVSRNRETVPMLTREYENLLYFYHRLTPSFRSTIPKPLLSREDPERFLFVESGLKGKSLPCVVKPEEGVAHQREISRMIENVLTWLLKFQRETQEETVEITDAWIEEEVRRPIERYGSIYPVDASEERFLNDHLKGWEEWKRTAIPITGHHGDFWVGNMLTDGASVSMCDWSFSQKKGWPFDDLFFFFSSLPVGKEEGDPLLSFENLFFKEHWFRRQVREAMARFFFQWELSPRFFFQLFPLFLIKQSIRESGEYHLHVLRNPLWRERLLFWIRNRSRLMEI